MELGLVDGRAEEFTPTDLQLTVFSLLVVTMISPTSALQGSKEGHRVQHHAKELGKSV